MLYPVPLPGVAGGLRIQQPMMSSVYAVDAVPRCRACGGQSSPAATRQALLRGTDPMQKNADIAWTTGTLLVEQAGAPRPPSVLYPRRPC